MGISTFDEATRPGGTGYVPIHFEGTCDVCGAVISLDYSFSQGLIDYGIDEQNRMYTWVRHYAVAPDGANPDCAIYSSRVIECK